MSGSPKRPHLDALIERARHHKMTPEEMQAQRESWARSCTPPPDECETCEGRGWNLKTLVLGDYEFSHRDACPTCHGTGKREASDGQG
jgi:DnaJ-class molecular chaperone